MIKKTLDLKGVKALNKAEQKEVIGGHLGGGFGCQPALVICYSDSDCPCNRRCGVTLDQVDPSTGEPIVFNDLCEFS